MGWYGAELPGESNGAGGGAMFCEARREAAVDGGCERRARSWRGEEGTEFRSGGMMLGGSLGRVVWVVVVVVVGVVRMYGGGCGEI